MTPQNMALSHLKQECLRRGLRMTSHRLAILEVISVAADHPTVFEIHARARQIDPGIAMATVYRTTAILEGAGIIKRHQFGPDRAQYELASAPPHDHLIDLQSGKVIEFHDDAFDALKAEIAHKLGYSISDARVEIYAHPIERSDK